MRTHYAKNVQRATWTTEIKFLGRCDARAHAQEDTRSCCSTTAHFDPNRYAYDDSRETHSVFGSSACTAPQTSVSLVRELSKGHASHRGICIWANACGGRQHQCTGPRNQAQHVTTHGTYGEVLLFFHFRDQPGRKSALMVVCNGNRRSMKVTRFGVNDGTNKAQNAIIFSTRTSKSPNTLR